MAEQRPPLPPFTEETARQTQLLQNRRNDLAVLMQEWEEVSAVIERE